MLFAADEVVAACDVCAGTRLRPVAPEANIVQCEACGYRFVSPRPSQAAIAAAYSDPHFYDGWVAADAGRLRMWRKRLNQVRRDASGPNLLDVGAGIGTFLAMARSEAGWQVVGTEVSTAAINLARQRHEIAMLAGNVEELPIAPASFNVVTLWHVLEHVPSPTGLLQACHRLLAPNGILVVAVPNDAESRQLPGRLKRLLGRPPSEPRYQPLSIGSEIHLSHFTLPVLRRLLQKEGFDILRVTVDDQYPEPNWKSELLIGLYRAVFRLTGNNLGQAMLVVARRV